MKLQDRNLSPSIQGTDVVLLQRTLCQLGFPIDEGEMAEERFGQTTQEAVAAFQYSCGLAVRA
ncbi:MAG: peptidoglycan-binding protein [Anaerolineae bacterium]|nr:peptidoglycan-binding protein [Anaerolineae bacterium]